MRAVVARRFRNYGAVRTDPGPRRTPGCRAAPEDSRDLALGHALLDLRGVGARDRALLPARRRTGTAPTPLTGARRRDRGVRRTSADRRAAGGSVRPHGRTAPRKTTALRRAPLAFGGWVHGMYVQIVSSVTSYTLGGVRGVSFALAASTDRRAVDAAVHRVVRFLRFQRAFTRSTNRARRHPWLFFLASAPKVANGS
jgi:hypothetical protein